MVVISQDTAIYGHQSDDFQLFKGLSDKCPPVIENSINQVIQFMEDGFVGAITVSGWKGFLKERIARYAAKRALKSNLFHILIWVTKLEDDSSLKKFQIQIADRLQIAFPRTDFGEDDESEGRVDEVLAGYIRKTLEEKKFLLVHDGRWELQDLIKVGIPNTRSANSSLVLIISTAGRRYHEQVSINDDLPDKELVDIFWEECIDISAALGLRRVQITPDVVKDCMLYFLLFDRHYYQHKIEIHWLLRYWLAEGLFGEPVLDLDATFRVGMAILEELQDRNIIHLKQGSCSCKWDDPLMTRLNALVRSSGTLLFRKFLIFPNFENVTPQEWENTDRITIQDIHNPPPSPPYCPKLSTIISLGFSKFLEKFFVNMENVRVVVVLYSIMTTLPSSICCLGKSLRLLHFQDCYFESIPVSTLRGLKKLEVLDLSKCSRLQGMTADIFEGLQSIRVLDLSECSRICSLPSSLSFLVNLELLLLGRCLSLSVLPSSVLPLKKLQVLDLSHTKLKEIPENFFVHMLKLKDLNLSFCKDLLSLLTSMSNLVNLKKLNLESCTKLTTVVPVLQHFSSSLEELNLSMCENLKDINHFSPSLEELRVLDLSHTPVEFMLLKNCSNLETLTLKSTRNLKMIDLSGTKIKELPLEDCDTGNTSNQLQLNWEQCGDHVKPQRHIALDEWRRKVGNTSGAYISAENARIFQSLTSSSSVWQSFLSRFLIYVCHCNERGKGRTLTPEKKALRCYPDIFSKLNPCAPLYERCLEIERSKRFPLGISGVLSHTSFLYLHDDMSIIKLSDMGVENMDDLKECWLEKCHKMGVVFDTRNGDQPILKSLEKLRISKLMKLTNMCVSDRFLNNRSFGQLKILQLEYCPKIVNVFTSDMCLEELEVLDIKFCAKLEEIFLGGASLGKLKTLSLWELPTLRSIVRNNVDLVSLEKAQMRGCPKLRKLPRCELKEGLVTVVAGESRWWEQLEWENKHQICFQPLEPFNK